MFKQILFHKSTITLIICKFESMIKLFKSKIFFILSSSKLDFYKCIYKIQTQAPYVDLLNCSSNRSTLTKLRFHAHKLNIEKGRYANISRQNRVCNVFGTASGENEIHFLLECSTYSREREDFFPEIKQTL